MFFVNEKNTYEVNKVYKGEEYYRKLLTNYAMSRFVWTGLPTTIPQQVLEKMLLFSESNRVVIVEKNNLIYVQPYNGTSVGVYDDFQPTSLYANPILGSGEIKTNFYTDEITPIIFDSLTDNPINETIKRYAKKLSQYDSSLDITTVNSRNTAIPTAMSQTAVVSLKNLLKKVREGWYDVLQVDKKNSLINEDTYKYLPTVPNNYFKTMTELAQLRNNELRLFLFEIGIILPKDKTEAVLSDESMNDKMLPLSRLTSSLQARKNGANMLNELYGLNVSVELNPILKKAYENFIENNESENKNNEI